ncbi:collagen-binding domain-containing protein [Companilactobacillus mishanensis]|uniref:collagen-binding domain-containing protein n=1 Tax=Companilactobacillus mishanensis TaxID=2486008 RepID=UPI001295B4D5|nr:collagen-binding domain-containing protein [Companilactobacillus mishanensis]MQS89515.1 LPXTG cell wall anchor domain-containing protein [Companilactobacillus mishanensis]
MKTKNFKGSRWAFSSIATCAAALSFLILTNTSMADTNVADGEIGEGNVSSSQVETPEQEADDLTVNNDEPEQNSDLTNEDSPAEDGTAPEAENDTTDVQNDQPVTTSNPEVQDGGTVYDDYPNVANNPLGVAAYFHIFSNDATLNAHTNGNLAVKNLDGNVNFGTNIHEELLDKEITYIQNITNIANSSFVSAGDTRTNKVIFGEGVDVNTTNPNRVNVDGKDIDHLTAQETYQDKNGQVYIDFAKEFENLRNSSTNLANASTPNHISNSNFDDMNNRVIDVNDYVVNKNNEIIINLDPDVLNGSTPLTIKGISSSEGGPTVIINVDTKGDSNYNVNSPIKIVYDDGSDRNSQETEYFGDNHLLWNFTDSTNSNKLHNGNINMNGVFQGSVLAPNATVNVGQNLDGNIVADKVNVNAETHRWDLQDETKDEEEDFETPDITNPDVEVPSIEEPEEPETPDITNPDVELPNVEEPEEPETPDVTDPEEPETPDVTDPEEPETPDVTDPEEPETPDVTDPEEPETPDVTDPEEPETPGVTDPEEPETPGVTDPETPEVPDVENPGGPEIPAEPDVDESAEGEDGEEDEDITSPDEKSDENGTSTSNVDKNTNGNSIIPEVPYQNANDKNGKLPQTGAERSAILSAAGLALLAGMAFVFRRRRE